MIHLRLPLDDLLAVVREFTESAMSRSALDRLSRRRGHSRRPVPEKAERTDKPFKAYEPGYIHVDVKYLPQMADERARRYVFVAIDRAKRWVFVAIKSRKTAAAAQSFLNALMRAAPFRIRTLLADNGKEFTDRLFGKGVKEARDQHKFDALCAALGIEHRLTRPRTLQTNGMVERFNGRREQVLRSHHFNSAEDLEKALLRYVWLYNQHLPQKALNHEALIQTMKRLHQSHPHLFQKSVRNHPRPDTQALRQEPGSAHEHSLAHTSMMFECGCPNDEPVPASQAPLQGAGEEHGAVAGAVCDGESGTVATNAVRAVQNGRVLRERNRGDEPRKGLRLVILG